MKKTITIAITCFLWAALAMDAQIWLTQDKTLYFGDKTTADTYSLGRPGWWNIMQRNGLDWTYNGNTLSFDMDYYRLRIASNKPVKFGTDTWYSSLYLYYYEIYSYTPCEPTANTPVSRTGGTGDVISQLRPLATTTSEGTVYGLDVDRLATVCPEAVETMADGTRLVSTGTLIALLQQKTQALQSRIAAQSEELAELKQTATTGRSFYNDGQTLYFSLPEGTQTAYVQLCNESGRQIRKANVTGESRMDIGAGDLPAGEGYASLIADGTLVETIKINLK